MTTCASSHQVFDNCVAEGASYPRQASTVGRTAHVLAIRNLPRVSGDDRPCLCEACSIHNACVVMQVGFDRDYAVADGSQDICDHGNET